MALSTLRICLDKLHLTNGYIKSSDGRAFMNPKNEHPAGWYLFWGLIIAGAIVGASALIGFLWLGHIIDVKAFNTILYS